MRVSQGKAQTPRSKSFSAQYTGSGRMDVAPLLVGRYMSLSDGARKPVLTDPRRLKLSA